jgi:general secretion pathway protein G
VPPAPEQSGEAAKAQAAEADIRALHEALMQYALNNAMTFPDSLELLVAVDANGHRYLNASTLPEDPWGHPYVYTAPEPGETRPVIGTLGADGAPGGEGEDRDIDSTMLLGEED